MRVPSFWPGTNAATSYPESNVVVGADVETRLVIVCMTPVAARDLADSLLTAGQNDFARVLRSSANDAYRAVAEGFEGTNTCVVPGKAGAGRGEEPPKCAPRPVCGEG